jgi:hypothetical protein
MDATTSSSQTWVIGLIIIALVFGLVILFSYRQRRARVRAWSELASQLGLVCDPGQNAGSQLAMRGDYQGHPLTMDTYTHTTGTGKNRHTHTYTRMVMEVNNPAGLLLELSREGLSDKIGKRVGAQDIETGDPELDQRLVIRGQPEEAVKRVLTSAALRQPLLSISPLDLRLENGEIRYKKSGMEKDKERLRGVFDLLSGLAAETERL